jgi:predicted nuclease of restriction endonuclease-like (RecB) superfamily
VRWPCALTRRNSSPAVRTDLLGDIRSLIESAREQTARAVNSRLVIMYWQIGRRIRQDVLGNERAEYGLEIVQTLSAQLTAEYGQGFGRRSLFRMLRFAEYFEEEQIVSALSTQLSWSHFVEILSIEDQLKREFYAEMCRVERWSIRTLRHKIGHLLYERTAVAKKPEALIKHDLAALRDEDRLTPDMVFRDPYFLDFLGLTGHHVEKDLEDAILRDLEAFILEPGDGFTFVARQKRITVDKSAEHIELLRLNDSGIRVAQYLTELPPKKLLEKKLHEAIQLARERLARSEVTRQPTK